MRRPTISMGDSSSLTKAAGALFLSAAACCGFAARAQPGELAASPPMGWNSWDAYGFTIDEAAFKANAAVLAQLKDLGWQYAIIDEGWYMKNPAGADLEAREYQLDDNGLLIPALDRFPSSARSTGLRSLADWTHRQGLRLGIHIVRGIPRTAVKKNLRVAGSHFRAADAADIAATCPWDDGNYGIRDNAAGQAYYDSMFKLYAAWKIDFVKVDCISNAPYRPTEIRQIDTAIRRAGRPMVLSLSPGPTDISHADEIARYAQMWRISNDIWDGWSFEHKEPGVDFPSGIAAAFDKLALWAAYARPGHWPDADMLPFGKLSPHPGWGEPRDTRLTAEEQTTQFVLWAIARSPLILGGNLIELDQLTRSLITNQGLIEMNQGAWTSHPVANLPTGYGNVRAWAASRLNSPSDDQIVAVFNPGSQPLTLRASWHALGSQRPRVAAVNLLTGERLGSDESVELQLAAHASAVYRLQSGQAPAAALGGLPFRDASLPIGTRVDDLVSRMTLEEKIPQMMHAAPAIPRLGIPAYNWWSEGLHGVAAAGIATVFPQAIGMAASFDPGLLHTEADIIATEFRAKYNEVLKAKGFTGWFHGLTVWSPNINIFRDPRWGRGQETYGEDPFLASRMGVAFVTGLQGDDPTHLKALSTPKHFAVHSGPESTRHTADVRISDHDLEDMYLPAFRATVLAGAGSVMCAYNSIDGKPACAQPLLLEEHLRKQWDFGGYVVSDCGAASDISAHHHYVKTMPEAMAVAIKSGMDIVCTWPEAAVQTESAAILSAVRDGLLSTEEVDRAVRRLFTARMKLGMFDPPAKDRYSTIPIAENASAPHRELALRAARETLVLLRNEGRLLPLTRPYKTIAVIGPNADNVTSLVGNYNGTPAHPVTVLAGVRQRFPAATVLYAEGSSLTGPPLSPVPGQFLKNDSGAPGFSANYFRGRDLQGTPVVSRIDDGVNFVWQNGAGPDLPSDFSVRWTGALVPQATGDYAVGFRGTDRFRVWLDGQLIAEADYAGNGRTLTRAIRLEAGHSYPVRIEYAQEHETGRAQFIWHEAAAGKDYLSAVRRADLIIAVLGLTSELEGEEMPIDIPGFRGGDRTTLDLPKAQRDLLEDLVATRKPVVLVLMNGSALGVNWADRHVGAILEAWYPGEEGGKAVAEALAGDFSPSGKLPITFYKSVDQLPAFDDYGVQGHTYRYFSAEPLYPFGYGLSYSSFAFTRLKLQENVLGPSDDLVATVDVTNTGKMAGDEVVEVYVSHPGIEGAPLRSLAAMQRVTLLPGETKAVPLRISNRDLSTVSSDGTRRISSGELRLWIGDGQPGARPPLRSAAGIAGSVTVQGEAILPK